MPLYRQAKEIVEKEILEGKYNLGDVVTTEDTIMARFRVSRITARKTLATLEQDGYVKRKKRLGTILVSSARKKEENVGVMFMQTSGHLYGDLSNRIINTLSTRGYHLFTHNFESTESELKLPSVLSFNPSFVILDGQNYPLIDALQKHSFDGTFIFIMFYLYDRKIPGAYILHDFQEGVRLQSGHLFRCGYENILNYTRKLEPSFLTGRQHIEIMHLGTIIQTAGEFLTTQGFKGRYEQIFYDREKDSVAQQVEYITNILRTFGKNTGIMCEQDSFARCIYMAAHSLGWNIPDDIGIIGYYNTPWASAFHPTLTSISINEGAIADNILDVVTSGISKEILVKPELVKGESTREVKT